MHPGLSAAFRKRVAAARPLAAAPEAAPGDEGEGAAEDAEDDGFAAFGWSDEEGDAILEKL